ncbi:MAG TPA: ribose 5-phosphate isomerase B [Spirochaetota bacterium]|nr:ribose 5-phosphate isomerase B [Spirochaetota bacterium]
MKIAIASDHAGFRLKNILKKHFAEHEFIDVGTHTEESCDYPDYAVLAAEKVVSGEAEAGIVICGTGIGISIAANKVKGARAALCCNEFMAEMSRRHNDANILALGARVIGDDLAIRIADVWIKASFEGGRHEKRVLKIGKIES